MKAITILLALLVLALAGCSREADNPQPEKAQDTTSVPQAATTSLTNAPTNPGEDAQLEAGAWLSFGHFLVERAQYNELDELGRADKVTLQHPVYGQIFVDAAGLLPGEVVARRYASAGTVEDPTIAGVIEVSVAAQDPEPQSNVIYLVQIDPKTQQIRHQAEVRRFTSPGLPSGYSGAASAVVGSAGTVVAFTFTDPSNPAAAVETIAFDVSTKQQVWARPGRISAAVFDAGGAMVEAPGKPNPASPGSYCNISALLDVSNGNELSSFDSEALQQDKSKGCAEVTVKSFPIAGIISVTAGPTDGERTVTAFDFVDKRDLKLDQNTVLVDEWSELAVVAPNGVENAGPVVIRDTVSGDTVFTIDEAKVTEQQLKVNALLNKQLWVSTTGGEPGCWTRLPVTR